MAMHRDYFFENPTATLNTTTLNFQRNWLNLYERAILESIKMAQAESIQDTPSLTEYFLTTRPGKTPQPKFDKRLQKPNDAASTEHNPQASILLLAVYLITSTTAPRPRTLDYTVQLLKPIHSTTTENLYQQFSTRTYSRLGNPWATTHSYPARTTHHNQDSR
jgi:hypothetical protein